MGLLPQHQELTVSTVERNLRLVYLLMQGSAAVLLISQPMD
jgi:hypothetical protein